MDLRIVKKTGYSISEVDGYFQKLQEKWIAGNFELDDMRYRKFTTEKGGYFIPQVDAIIEQIIPALVQRHKKYIVATGGLEVWTTFLDKETKYIILQLKKARKMRFEDPHTGGTYYTKASVDKLLDKIKSSFATNYGKKLDIRKLIEHKFEMTKNPKKAYINAQVDAFLDRLVVFLIERA
ncbi:DivIVA domain-containing protein [Actinomycetota bacterium]|nr:DivIVA domain-containing protein [Actinomycetota bacterium]